MNPTIKVLRLDHLTVDPAVQRGLDEGWVSRKLAAEGFRPEAMGVPVVSHRDNGAYHVIDGQHRRALAVQAGHPELEVECQVHEGLTRAEEAAMFRLLNDRRSVQILDKFVVRVVEGDPTAVALNKLLRKHGWTVGAGKNDGRFAAVAALETVYRGARIRKGEQPDSVDLLLSIVTTAWGHKIEAVRGEIVHGLGMVLLQYEGQLDLAKIINELAAHEGGPLGLVGKAKGLYALRGGRVSDAMADVIVGLHNKSKRKRLPDWRAA